MFLEFSFRLPLKTPRNYINSAIGQVKAFTDGQLFAIWLTRVFPGIVERFMDAVFLLGYILALRFIFFLALEKPETVKGVGLVVFFIFAAFAVPLPLMLIKKEVLNSSVPNIFLAGASIFFFALVITRTFSKVRRS